MFQKNLQSDTFLLKSTIQNFEKYENNNVCRIFCSVIIFNKAKVYLFDYSLYKLAW